MLIKKINYLLLFVLFCLLVGQTINFPTADLGRHLQNGRHFFSSPQKVLETNFYSYTYPDYSFLNHHWGSGAVFFFIEKVFSFTGLSVFFVGINLLTLWLFFDVAQKSAGFSVSFLTALVVLPILANRTEIRPEAFSSLFSGFFFWILWHWQNARISSKYLYLLPFLLGLWINLHVYFFLGFFLIGVFWLDSILSKSKSLFLVGLLSFFAAFLNPAGFKGVIYPLRIFEGYGYRLFENQSVWFLDKIVNYPPSLYFKISFIILLLSWLYVFISKKKISFCNLLFTFFFSYLGWTAVRNFSLFGFFALPIIAYNFQDVFKKETDMHFFMAGSLGFLLFLGLLALNSNYWMGRIAFGLGLRKGTSQAAEFFLKNKLEGPIFNNYDIGGYLIYYLFPQEKVFVDNRPEAYPANFFTEIYIPMQENNDKWQEIDKYYHFNTIFFYRHDLTPWGQQFLINRTGDPDWVPVYVDDWSIIFIKRNERNQEIIKESELPKGMFNISR